MAYNWGGTNHFLWWSSKYPPTPQQKKGCQVPRMGRFSTTPIRKHGRFSKSLWVLWGILLYHDRIMFEGKSFRKGSRIPGGDPLGVFKVTFSGVKSEVPFLVKSLKLVNWILSISPWIRWKSLHCSDYSTMFFKCWDLSSILIVILDGRTIPSQNLVLHHVGR